MILNCCVFSYLFVCFYPIERYVFDFRVDAKHKKTWNGLSLQLSQRGDYKTGIAHFSSDPAGMLGPGPVLQMRPYKPWSHVIASVTHKRTLTAKSCKCQA
jgi:hypothetical protein